MSGDAKKLRGAISGFGEVAARAHLPGWLTRDNVNLSVVHDPISARRHEAIRLIKNVRVYDDLELMLDGEAPDFVDIASPPALHFDAVRSALSSGVHVLVEKPLCLTLAEFDQLTALANEKGRVLMCVHNWKYAPAYAAARIAIEAGRVGDVRQLSIDRLRTAPAGAGGSGGRWRLAASSGGGILIDHGWHVFYLMHWLLGAAAPEAITAHLESSGDIDVDDVADLKVAFSGSRHAIAHLSWRSSARKTSALIEGDLGLIAIDGDRVTLTDCSGRSEVLPVAESGDDSYHAAWFGGVAGEFEHAIAEGPESATARLNLMEARCALAIIAGARESSARGGLEVKIDRDS